MASRAVEPEDRSAGEITQDDTVHTERVVDVDAGAIMDVSTVGDLSVVHRFEVPNSDWGVAAPRRVYAYVPRRARPPWAKPDVLVLADDLPNYLRAERSFHALTESGLRDLLEAPARNGKRITSPIVAIPTPSTNGLAGIVERLEKSGVPVIPLRDIVEERCRLAFLDDSRPSVNPMGWFRRAVVRTIDLAVSFVGIAVFLALLPPIALAIWLEDQGPVFYVQERIGKGGATFPLFKFRSMRTDAEKKGPMWATLRDDRVTKIGALLRKTKLDELPQFINVVLGQMSLVGPRPERAVFAETLRRLIPHYDVRQQVRPGVTGWGTVKVGYGNSVEAKYLTHQYDLYHMKNRTIRFDLEILFRSFLAIVARSERQDRFML